MSAPRRKKTYFIKKGDTSPALSATLEQANGQPIDLTQASSVSFAMTRNGGGKSVSGTCDINPDPTTGKVEYDWAALDTDTEGDYRAEFQITWGDGKKQTIPNEGYEKIVIFSDIAS